MSGYTSDQGPGPAFVAAFGDDARGLLVAAVRDGYVTACEHHDPDRGGDAQTFGFTLYKYCAHQIVQRAKKIKDVIKILSRTPTFRFALGEFELACHRVGDSEYDNIAQCFPGNDGAVVRMIEPQLWLPNVARRVGLQAARKAVLAHMGNPEDGLRALYLCIPERATEDRISAWAYTELVWRADLDARPRTTTSVEERAPEEAIEEPVVKRRARKVDDGREA